MPMLGGFHTARCVQRCISKYIKGTGVEAALIETGVFGVKVTESTCHKLCTISERDPNPFWRK